MQERLIGVETKVAFLERGLEELDGVIQLLWERLDHLHRLVDEKQSDDGES